MPYEILDHVADAGVRGIGATLEEAFAEAARGMFSLMADLTAVRATRAVKIGVRADTLEGLLVSWLGELLTRRDTLGLMFSRFEARIEAEDGRWRLTGHAWGEKVTPERHRLGVEVKAATYFGVRVEKRTTDYIAQCVVDL